MNIYKDAVETFGIGPQMLKAAEEACELSLELMHIFNGKKTDPLNFVQEIADVEIMCSQLREMVGHLVVDNAKKLKLERLAGLIAEKKGDTK